jgi:hypothetical protein
MPGTLTPSMVTLWPTKAPKSTKLDERGSPTTAVRRVVGMVGVCRGVVVGLTREALLASRGLWSNPSFTRGTNVPLMGM